ncbi:hypothetical protein AB0O28_18910 [Microbispora sp. NPDC088329]|uniref:hypothetical protein n=1 Tax=Microbispora sp. NPDC088329 TaxID=3154869 RepID=UPI00343C42C3
MSEKDTSRYHKGPCRLVFADGFRINVAVELCWMPRYRRWFGDLTAIRPDGDALADRIEQHAQLHFEDGTSGVVKLRIMPHFGTDCLVFGVTGVGVPPFSRVAA